MTTPSRVPEVEPLEAQRRIEAGALHLDVRERDEHARERIRGAVPLPLSEVLQRLEELPRDRQIVVSCRSGARSEHAAAMMRDASLDAVNLAGGILAWQAEGLPTEQG